MKASHTATQRRVSPPSSSGIISCPACGGKLKCDSKWCPACNFTGSDTLAMFPDSPPPLLPILDAANLFNEADLHKIEAARKSISRRFPQFQWRICSVSLAHETSLPLFGFWLLNACPLNDGETARQRASTILLLINARSGQAAVIPGYAAEPYLSDYDWMAILKTMVEPWRTKNRADLIIRFFKCSRHHLELAWNRCGTGISNEVF